jgi:hypothetical protein
MVFTFAIARFLAFSRAKCAKSRTLMNKTPLEAVQDKITPEDSLNVEGRVCKRLCEIFHDFGIINSSNKIW